MKPLRIALIGCGVHSRSQHAAPMAEYARRNPGRIELAAACDLQAERAQGFCRDYGFARSFGDWRLMIAETKPDAVVCVVPDTHVTEMTISLLKEGIPCTVEKPLGTSPEQTHAMAEASMRTGTPHMVSVNRRFSTHLNQAIGWATSMGPIRFVRAAMMRSGRNRPDFIWKTAIHVVDTLIHVAGPIRGYTRRVVELDGLPPTWQLISIEFMSGCLGELTIAPMVGYIEESYELFGRDCVARADVLGPLSPAARWSCRRGDELVAQSLPPVGDSPSFFNDGSYAEFSHLVECLSSGRPLGPTIAEVVPGMEMCFELSGIQV